MKTKQMGKRVILTFTLNEEKRYKDTIRANIDAFNIDIILINNGYCLELTPLLRVY